MFNIHGYDKIAIDTEGTGLRYPIDYAFAFGIAVPGKAIAIDLRTNENAVDWINRELAAYPGKIYAHYASFDYRMAHRAGIRIPLEKLHCTSVQACLINEHEASVFPWTRSAPGNYSLDYLAQKYCGIGKDHSFEDKARAFFGSPKMSRDTIMSRIAELPWDIVGPYLEQDCVATLALAEWQEKEIERQNLHKIVAFEHRVMPELIKAEMRGVHVSEERAMAAIPKMDEQVSEAQWKLNNVAGKEVNVNSNPHIIQLLDPKYRDGEWWVGNEMIGTTAAGKPSFKGDILKNLNHPAASMVTELRSLLKTRDTFLKKHVLEHSVNGVVYPTINQAKGDEGGTGTGRLSYVDPALQQIPARNKKVASIIKPCFIPPPGMKWLEPDLQSFEVRIFAHLVAAYNDHLVHVYEQDPKTDFHQMVADMTGLVRNAEYSGQPNSKQLNLSMIFNQGKGATAAKMGMPWEWAEFETVEYGKPKTIRYQKAGPEAEAVIELYHRRVPGVRELAERCKKAAEKHGAIETAFGRRLRFPKGYKSYKASGLLIQATAADRNKENWLLIGEALGNDGHLILNTHDSYSTAVPEDWRPVYKRMKDAIESPRLRVPLILDLDGVGGDWWSAKCGEEK